MHRARGSTTARPRPPVRAIAPALAWALGLVLAQLPLPLALPLALPQELELELELVQAQAQARLRTRPRLQLQTARLRQPKLYKALLMRPRVLTPPLELLLQQLTLMLWTHHSLATVGRVARGAQVQIQVWTDLRHRRRRGDRHSQRLTASLRGRAVAQTPGAVGAWTAAASSLST